MARNFTPRYYEIEQSLRALIASARPSDPLPSESDLCARFGVSRMTARHAMQRLVQDGLIYRVAGRGTFVAMPHVHRQANTLTSFTAEMERRGKQPRSDVLEADLKEPTAEDRASLQLRTGQQVVVVTRIRLADDVAIAHERAAFPPRWSELLDSDLAGGSLHMTLLGLGVVPTRGRATLSSTAATPDDAERLGIEPHAPLLVERRLIRDQHDDPLEYTESRYAAERYMLEVSFEREHAAGG